PPNFMPPPLYPPPFYPPPPPPPGRSVGRMLLMTFLVLLLVGSFGLNLILIAGSAVGGSSTRFTTLVEGDSNEIVAVIPVSGAIMGDVSAQVSRFIDQAEKDPSVKAVVLHIDSPGGSVTASDEIHHQVRQLKARRNIPVI